jgi:AraC-like DNA-binding protein
MDEMSTTRTRASFGEGVRLRRFALSEAIEVCICRYRRTRGARVRATSNRIEIGVQLAGRFMHSGHWTGRHVYRAGFIHVVAPGERYDCAYAAGDEEGLGLWFSVDPKALGVDDPQRELRCTASGPLRERTIEDLARSLCALPTRARPSAEDVLETLRGWTGRRFEVSKPDRAIEARRHLERYFDCELSLALIAADFGVHPATLLRTFRQRYGLTPIQYRLKTRLNCAGRLAWQFPELSTQQIAVDSGFADLSYFFRQFMRYFGTTPARYRRDDSTSRTSRSFNPRVSAATL